MSGQGRDKHVVYEVVADLRLERVAAVLFDIKSKAL